MIDCQWSGVCHKSLLSKGLLRVYATVGRGGGGIAFAARKGSIQEFKGSKISFDEY